MDKVVVTRHAALVEYLRHVGEVAGDVAVISHVTADQIKGKHVYGVLPLHLAAEAAQVTEIPLAIPAELRGKELSFEQMVQYAQPARTYIVKTV
jgi:putative CRISPR-associated protein (TIGR02620 family)